MPWVQIRFVSFTSLFIYMTALIIEDPIVSFNIGWNLSFLIVLLKTIIFQIILILFFLYNILRFVQFQKIHTNFKKLIWKIYQNLKQLYYCLEQFSFYSDFFQVNINKSVNNDFYFSNCFSSYFFLQKVLIMLGEK